MRIFLISLLLVMPALSRSQNGYGNQWIFGSFNDPPPASTILNFNGDTLKIEPIEKPMELEGSCAIMCDSVGKLLFYSNGCYIANTTHQMMANGDSIGKGKLETSFCKTGGNPLNQGIIALPKPGSNHLFYLFYTDIGSPYFMQPFFPLAPVTMYYSIIDMTLENGLGAVVEKNKVIIQDTFARSMIQASRHFDGKSWWIIMPKSHSNCYWTLLLTENGIDTIFNQCVGQIWGDRDSQGQAVFSPNSKYYARFNYFYGLNIYNFNNITGSLSQPVVSDFGQDTFFLSGLAFSPNSRFVYTSTYNKLWQFDTRENDISTTRILIGELTTPPNIQVITHLNQAQVAPDGKIYIGGAGEFKHLHVINRPNCYGLECGLEQYALEMAGRSHYTMPNLPHFNYWNEADTCETASVNTIDGSNHKSIKIFPNPFFFSHLC
ncbi:MAG: hypothetical protein JNN28_17645 [Saprospiraceae bacterium]|nr:hypothetical protein [Saprospiraceae bacterium]